MSNNVLIKNKKGYKKTKLGWIPEDWDVVKFKDIGQSIIGLTYSPNDIVEKGLLVLRSSNIKDSKVVCDDNVYVSKKVPKKLITKSNDILMCVRNGSKNLVGKSALIKANNEGYTFGAFMSILRSKYNSFLYQFLQSSYAKKQYTGATSATINQITSKDLDLLQIPFPKIQEQEKIVEILSAWDDGIETLEKLIEQKEILKTSLAQKCFRRKNILFPLKQHKLGELFKNRKETNCCDLELLSVCDGLGIIPRSQLNAKDNSNEDKSKYLKVCIGDLAYNTMRMWQGRCGVSSYEGIVSPAYTVCIPKDHIDVDYMYYLFKTPHMIHDFWRYSQGIVDDTLNLKFNNFEVIKIWIPDKETQTKIAKLLKSYDEEIQLLNSKLEKLKEQKKGLMQKLLTGNIRVKIS